MSILVPILGILSNVLFYGFLIWIGVKTKNFETEFSNLSIVGKIYRVIFIIIMAETIIAVIGLLIYKILIWGVVAMAVIVIILILAFKGPN